MRKWDKQNNKDYQVKKVPDTTVIYTKATDYVKEYGTKIDYQVKQVPVTPVIYTKHNTDGIDIRTTSPIRYNRACLCKDNTYSIDCCEGNLLQQGIGNILVKMRLGEFSSAFSRAFARRFKQK